MLATRVFVSQSRRIAASSNKSSSVSHHNTKSNNKRPPVPKSLRNAVWDTYIGPHYTSKCYVSWCKTVITPFTFEVGHNIPHSKGGSTDIANLRPLCSQCNRSMGNMYTIDEYDSMYRSDAVPLLPIGMEHE